jgi:MGT family glycosyltransferase
MACVLMASVPIAGHVQPLVRVCRELCARGHDVHWYTGSSYAETVQRAGATFAPYRRALDFDDRSLSTHFPGRGHLAGVRQLKFDLMRVFTDQALGQLADLERLAEERKPLLLVADPLMLGALLFKERSGVPLMMINVVALPMRGREVAPFGLGLEPTDRWYGPLRNRVLYLGQQVLFDDVQRHWRQVRARVGLATRRSLFDASLDATAFVQPTVPGFEYPRSDLPDNVTFVGALHPDFPSPDPTLLAGLRTPLVHVTQGTISNVDPHLIAPALKGLAREPLAVLVATGGRSARELGLEPLPVNARVVPFVSYPELLPRTAAMVTNGGYGGVQLALAHGVPLVVWGTTEDKPEVAARVAWSGAGIRLPGARAPRPAEVRDAVREVLHTPSYRAHARALALEYARFDAPGRVGDLCDAMLSEASLALAATRCGARA